MKIIGLTGHSGSGRNEVAELLVNAHGFLRLSFSDMVARELHDEVNVPGKKVTDDYLDGRSLSTIPWRSSEFLDFLTRSFDSKFSDSFLSKSRSSRDFSNLWATEYRRTQNPMYWVSKLRREIDLAPAHAKIVVSDIRFATELNLVRSYEGSEFWRIGDRQFEERPGYTPHMSDRFVGSFPVSHALQYDEDIEDSVATILRAHLPLKPLRSVAVEDSQAQILSQIQAQLRTLIDLMRRIEFQLKKDH